MSGDRMNYREVLFSFFDWLFYGVLTPFVIAISRRFPLAKTKARDGTQRFMPFAPFCSASPGPPAACSLNFIPRPRLRRQRPPLVCRLGVHDVPFWRRGLSLPWSASSTRFAISSRHASATTQVARLSEQLTGARLAALQAQLNPHFLFNSLNTVERARARRRHAAGDAGHRAAVAKCCARRLSRSRDNEVSLDDELELVRQYLAVEQARFSDRLRPRSTSPADLLSAAVPSFALQHLVENAVRHGIARRSDAGRSRSPRGASGEHARGQLSPTTDRVRVTSRRPSPDTDWPTRASVCARCTARRVARPRARPSHGAVATAAHSVSRAVLEARRDDE